MDHVTARKVEGADDLADERALPAPDHVGERGVDHEDPHHEEGDDRAEAHAPGRGAGDDSGGDHGEGHLEGDVDDGGVEGALRGLGGLGHHVLDQAGEPQLVEAAEPREGAVATVGKRPARDDPREAHDPDCRERHEHGVHDVLTPGEAAVEERQAGRHEQNEHRAEEHERGRAGVVHGRASPKRRNGRTSAMLPPLIASTSVGERLFTSGRTYRNVGSRLEIVGSTLETSLSFARLLG